MSEIKEISKYIADYKFEEALKLIESGERIPEDINTYSLQAFFDYIVKGKRFDIINLLIDRKEIPTDVYEYDTFNKTILETLIKWLPVDDDTLNEFEKLIGRFENINDEVAGNTLLSFAINEKAKPAIIQSLINAGCDSGFKNTAEDNLIAQTVRINMMPKDDQLAYIDILLKAGVDPSDINVEKKNALHLAAESHKRDLVKPLLDAGARPNEQDWHGQTAYYHAIAFTGGDDSIYNQLTEVEAPDFTLLDNSQETLLSVYLRSIQGSDRENTLLEKMIDDGADLTQSGEYYGKPKSGWDWVVEKPIATLQMALGKTGYDVNEQDNDGNTLLHKVCRIDCNYSQETAKELYKKVKLLLENGADVNITNNKDETAVMLASTDNLKGKIVELLLKK